jgi:hypothetical protein
MGQAWAEKAGSYSLGELMEESHSAAEAVVRCDSEAVAGYGYGDCTSRVIKDTADMVGCNSAVRGDHFVVAFIEGVRLVKGI